MNRVDNRKDVLLLLLYGNGDEGSEPIEGRTRLMKLLYLLGVETRIAEKLGITKWYEFRPYNYGPFSSEVFDDIDFLRNVDLVKSVERGSQTRAESWEDSMVIEEAGVAGEISDIEPVFEQEIFFLTEKGKDFVEEKLIGAENLSEDILEAIRHVRREYGNLTLSSLLRYVYSKHPESAEKSHLTHLRGQSFS